MHGSIKLPMLITLESMLSNRQVKRMLINHFGDTICFTYPKEVRKSQMFFSSKICSVDTVETLRSNDPVKVCATKLRKECEEFDFLLTSSYCNANDLKISIDHYNTHRPETWEVFLNTLFPYRKEVRDYQDEI